MKSLLRKWKLFKLSYRLDGDYETPDPSQLDDEERRFLKEQQAVIGLLKNSSEAFRENPSVFLRNRILNHLDDQTGSVETPVPSATLAPFFKPALAVLACLILATLSVVQWRQDRLFAAREEAIVQATRQVTTLVNLAEKDLITQVGARIDDPLEKEMEHVLYDAKTAITSLKKAFIPQTLLASVDVDSN